MRRRHTEQRDQACSTSAWNRRSPGSIGTWIAALQARTSPLPQKRRPAGRRRTRRGRARCPIAPTGCGRCRRRHRRRCRSSARYSTGIGRRGEPEPAFVGSARGRVGAADRRRAEDQGMRRRRGRQRAGAYRRRRVGGVGIARLDCSEQIAAAAAGTAATGSAPGRTSSPRRRRRSEPRRDRRYVCPRPPGTRTASPSIHRCRPGRRRRR